MVGALHSRQAGIRSSEGTTLIELLVSMVIFSIIGLLLAQVFRSTVRSTAALRTALKAEESFEGILQVLRHGIEHQQALHAVQTVIIHSRGTLRNRTGQDIAPSSGANAVAEDGSAVSLLRLDASILLRRIPHGSRERFYFCAPQRFSTATLPDPALWLALTPDGYLEAAGNPQRVVATSGPSSCEGGKLFQIPLQQIRNPLFALNLSPQSESTLSQEPELQLKLAVALVPVEELFSIYRSTGNTLRRIAHHSRDNQPVAYDVLSFTVQPGAEEGNFLVSVRFPFGSTQQTLLPFNQSLRIHPLDVML